MFPNQMHLFSINFNLSVLDQESINYFFMLILGNVKHADNFDAIFSCNMCMIKGF